MVFAIGGKTTIANQPTPRNIETTATIFRFRISSLVSGVPSMGGIVDSSLVCGKDVGIALGYFTRKDCPGTKVIANG